MKKKCQGLVLYVTTFFTQQAGSDPSGPLVQVAQTLAGAWSITVDVHAVSTPLAFNEDFCADDTEKALEQAGRLRAMADATFKDDANPMRFPAIFTPLRGLFKPNAPVPDYAAPQEVGVTYDCPDPVTHQVPDIMKTGWSPWAVIDSNTSQWTSDKATLIHEMGHGAGLQHVWSQAPQGPSPSNAFDLMCADGPKSARVLNLVSCRKFLTAYFAKKP
jgi:hypothetical protein